MGLSLRVEIVPNRKVFLEDVTLVRILLHLEFLIEQDHVVHRDIIGQSELFDNSAFSFHDFF